MGIAFIGHPHFSSRLALEFQDRGYKTIMLDYNEWGHNFFTSIKAVINYQVLHFISGTGYRKLFYALVLRFILRKKILVHFVGSDVTRMKTRKYFDRINWVGALKLAHRVFCVAPWLRDELKPYGNSESFALFFRKFTFKQMMLPEKFTILSYIPETRPEFYGKSIVEQLIVANPRFHFIILGGSDFYHYPNVECHTIDYKMDMIKFYNRTSVLLRLTEHDGLSNMVMESLAMNRHVVWTYDFPYVHQSEKEFEKVQKLLKKIHNNNLPNTSTKWMQTHFDYTLFLNTLEAMYKNPNTPVPKGLYS